MTTYISNKPNTYGIPYRRGGKIFRATYCNRCDRAHEKKMMWKPKEATFSNKLKYFSDFLENNKILLEQFQIKYSSVSSLNHTDDLNDAFTSIRDQLIKCLAKYKKNGYIGEYNQNKYIDHFLTGSKTDLDTAKVYLDFLTILYNISLLVYHCNPNKEDSINCKNKISKMIKFQTDSYNIIKTGYLLINSGAMAKDLVIYILKPMFTGKSKSTIKLASEDIQAIQSIASVANNTIEETNQLEEVVPVAQHEVLFYTSTGDAITQEDMDNFDFNYHEEEYDDGYDIQEEDYDW